ncbi:MAG: HlyD family efflux transporter periplasmic adaptor subunit [Planctomycetaceae bacterium]|nr:HlyD family efflux transporter periplasmic adaptor subunit [Planctomycetaceae bacterium]
MSIGEMIPSSFRPVPLRARPDLEFERFDEGPDAGFSVKDPLGLQYHRLEPSQFAVLQLLDGRRSLRELKAAINRDFPAIGFTLDELQSLIVDLHQKGLVLSDRLGQAQTLQNRVRKNRGKQAMSLFGQILYTRLPGWNPMRTLTALLPWVRWVYSTPFIVLASLFVASSWLLVLVQFAEFRSRLPEFQQFFAWPNIMWLWVTLAGSKILHEFGHGLTCHYYGRRCHEMGVMLLVFTPTLYCDVTDAWLIRDRWPRIWIGAGGMLFETVLSAFAIYVWWFSAPGLINHLALNVFFVTTITTVIFNLNPLMRFDGYYMLADYLGIPNMRSQAERLLDRSLARNVYGFDLLPDPLLPQHNQGWFAAYAIASSAYGWFVFGSIMLFLYSWLKPHQLQSLGITAAFFSMAGLLMSLGVRTYRIGKTPRHGPVRWWSVALAAVVFVAALSAVLFAPIPWYVEAAAIIEPAGVVHLYSAVPGRLVEIKVQPGDLVAAGDVLLVLENEELADRARKLEDDLAAQKVLVAAARTADNASDYSVASEHQLGLEKQLAEVREQVQHLTVTAPTAGRIVAADYRSPPPDLPDRALPQWHATPLDRQNLGSWIEIRTQLASIAPGEGLQAVLYLPQVHRNEVTVGDRVSLKLDSLPDRVFRGEIAEMSHQQAETVPIALSTKAGGPLATESLPDQTERLQELTYQAKVNLTDDEHVLRTGMRGSARFIVAEHTTAWWIAQSLRRLFRFRM